MLTGRGTKYGMIDVDVDVDVEIDTDTDVLALSRFQTTKQQQQVNQFIINHTSPTLPASNSKASIG